MHFPDFAREIEARKQSFLYRSLKSIERRKHGRLFHQGKILLNLCSNDYLGMSERLFPKDIAHSEAVPFGTTSSRLLIGDHPSFQELETIMAKLKGTESCLVVSCGYMANIGVISALVSRGDAVYSDRLNHASIVDGIRLSGAKHLRYRHNDMGHLEQLLRKTSLSYRRKLVVTESLFSMDGDQSPLRELTVLKERYGAWLMVDEAHSGGIYGNQGAGLVDALGIADRVDIQIGTFSKAYGGYGAYIATCNTIREYLINTNRSFIYTTSLPPFIIQMNIKAVKMAMEDKKSRNRLRENITFFRKQLQHIGIEENKESPIIPVYLKNQEQALDVAKKLWKAGIAVIAIRPPTVPENTSRLRLSVTASHNIADLRDAAHKINNAIS